MTEENLTPYIPIGTLFKYLLKDYRRERQRTIHMEAQARGLLKRNAYLEQEIGKVKQRLLKKVEKSEKYFYDNGKLATITGRLIPGIRHLISIPAGLAKMNYWTFLLYTAIGAGAWNCILAALGWWLHSFVPEEQLNDKILEYGEYIKVVIMTLVALAVVYFMVKYLYKRFYKKG